MDFVNAAIVIIFNLAVLGLLVWFVGSIALRFVGWGWMLFGIAIAVSGAANGSATFGTHALALFNIGLGAVFWLGGHALHRVRHGHWKSSILRRVAFRACSDGPETPRPPATEACRTEQWEEMTRHTPPSCSASASSSTR